MEGERDEHAKSRSEREEGKETEEYIDFNPKKKISLHTVLGRLMVEMHTYTHNNSK